MLLDPKSAFPLAEQLRSPEGAPLGVVFSFVSGLYFRGKAAYAQQFAPGSGGLPRAFVITAGGGLCQLTDRVDERRLRGWATVSIHEDNPHFTAPLVRHASGLLETHGEAARFVLLGSVATGKYVAPLLEVFGERLFFPSEFKGRGDMSRGALLLRAVREQRELEYEPLLFRELEPER
ncbi:MAG TPA: hypothetical protein VG937_07600 [Polyangiaceae bacterium]|nr:hypothetical protein [Polyangiaceae bacterium]